MWWFGGLEDKASVAGRGGGFSGRVDWTYSMALAQWLDVHEGQRLVALEELEGGDLACIEPWCEPSRFLGGEAA